MFIEIKKLNSSGVDGRFSEDQDNVTDLFYSMIWHFGKGQCKRL